MRTTLVELDEAEMLHTIERVLTQRLGGRISIVRFQREASPYATLFPVEIVSISTDAGQTLRLFVKHFGDEQWDHPDKQCRDREIRIYEQLLQDEGLPVVNYYGSRANDATGRREMYLEFVDDWKLKYHQLEHWFTAARRLAHLHLHFARRRERLMASDFLLRFDGNYFQAWAERAVDALSERDAALGRRLSELLRGYQGVVELIARQPPTLVHNDLSAKNVIASTAVTPARICIVDWEMAGFGCGVLDLVHLKYNRLDPENDRRFCEAYFAELKGTELHADDVGEQNRLVGACDFVTTVFRLAHCIAWNESAAHVAKRLERLTELGTELSGRAG